jgi:hypothetical protein
VVAGCVAGACFTPAPARPLSVSSTNPFDWRQTSDVPLFGEISFPLALFAIAIFITVYTRSEHDQISCWLFISLQDSNAGISVVNRTFGYLRRGMVGLRVMYGRAEHESDRTNKALTNLPVDAGCLAASSARYCRRLLAEVQSTPRKEKNEI